jgi:beta-glucosidase
VPVVTPTPPARAEDGFGALASRAAAHRDDLDAEVDALLAELSPDERLAMMSGDLDFWPGLVEMLRGGYGHTPYVGGAVERLGLPGIRFCDGPRGVTLGRSTCFPVAMARGATWDPELEARVGAAIGAEARAQGANLIGSVCVNLLHHPAWGRAQETYGEDPGHVGAMGAAAVRGVQRHVVACVKHFALNNMENARFQVDVRASPRVLHEVYLRQFRRCVDEGAGSVMSAYNSVNGAWCGHNRPLLTEILKRRWGFDGFVITDWIFGIRDAEPAANAGVDVEMPFRMHFAAHLRDLVEAGRVPAERVDDAARRILRTLLRAAATTEVPTAGDLVAGPAHRALAREVARRAMVLLRNEPVDGTPTLPLRAEGLRQLAVVGPLADVGSIGDAGSSAVRPPDVVTPLAGLRAALGGAVVGDDGRDPARAARLAAAADAAVVVVGYTADDEGEYTDVAETPELVALFPPLAPDDPAAAALGDAIASPARAGRGGDRLRLTLHDQDEQLLRAVAAAQPRTIAVLVTGSAVVTERWRDEIPAIVVAWYPGMEGGHALADVLLGRVNPSGRLPCAFPVDEADLPPFDRDARHAEYGLWHGQQHLDRTGRRAAYPLGWGLTYTEFRYGAPHARLGDDAIELEVPLANVGARDGVEVVQCYAAAPQSAVERPPRWLVGFQAVALAAGATGTVRLDVPVDALAYWDEARDDFVVEATRYELVVGAHAAATGDSVRVELTEPSARR